MPHTATLRVVAELLLGKPDPSTEAWFANADRASTYASALAAEGTYARVTVTDHIGATWDVRA